MANLASQSIKLFGKPEKIKEVFDYILGEKKQDFEDGSFETGAFPISYTTIYLDKNEIGLQTNFAPASTIEISKKFPEVGFYSTSFTDGIGFEEIDYTLGGTDLYLVYIQVDGPREWKEVTGYDMEDVNDIVKHYIKNHPYDK